MARASAQGDHHTWALAFFNLVEDGEVLLDAFDVPDVILSCKDYVMNGGIMDVGHIVFCSLCNYLFKTQWHLCTSLNSIIKCNVRISIMGFWGIAFGANV